MGQVLVPDPQDEELPGVMASEFVPPLGWWTIQGEALLGLLRRAASGEDPDLLYAEAYANAEHDRPTDV